MRPLTLEEVVTAMEGALARPVTGGSISGVVTDSRSVGPGDLFVAIRGARFDGHDFVGEAFAGGAMAAVVRNEFDAHVPAVRRSGVTMSSPSPVLIRVDDPVTAMGRLARYYRRSALGRSVTVVAVTGSNGKTTTKSMIAHVLSGRWRGRASIKSYNNAIGVPLTLLSVDAADSFVVCEVGTNAPGEIAGLARLIEPDIAVLTGISEAHLERLGSLREIAEEKLSLFRHLRAEGFAVFNADHELLRDAMVRDHDLRQLKRVGFGCHKEAELRLTDLQAGSVTTDDGQSRSMMAFKVNDRFCYRLNAPGRHNVFNALAAVGVARRFGMDDEEIADRLASFVLPEMRLQFEKVGRLTLVNDAYNANPASMKAAVDVLAEAPAAGRRVLIVGDMLELGTDSVRLHREVAEHIGRSRLDLVIAVGENARLIGRTVQAVSEDRIETHAYASPALARRRLVSYLKQDDIVLLKGSRLLKLEELAGLIRTWAASAPAQRAARRNAAGLPPRVKV